MNTVGSIQKWLTFGLSPDQEDRFRQANFSADVAQARICIFLLILPLVGFVVNDYDFFRLSWTFYELLALRFALLAYTTVVIKSLPGLTNYQSYYRVEFYWGLFYAFIAILVHVTRPISFLAHTIIIILLVFVTVLFIPNRFTNHLTISLVYTIGEMLILTQSLWTSPK